MVVVAVVVVVVVVVVVAVALIFAIIVAAESRYTRPNTPLPTQLDHRLLENC